MRWKLYHRAKRYLRFLYQYLFLERPRGLDFTMRDAALYKKSYGLYHGYSKTEEEHLHLIFENLSYETERRLLDIGCGKGVVLKEAVNYPFAKVAGIELETELLHTAKKNIRILGLEDKIDCIHADAVSFNEYKDYNVFFLFNPFSEQVLSKVVKRISDGRPEKEYPVTFIYHNPRFLHIFEKREDFTIIKWLHDPVKDYDTCIFELTGEVSFRDKKVKASGLEQE